MPSSASGVRSLCARVSALASHSLTVAWGYFLLLSGLLLDALPLTANGKIDLKALEELSRVARKEYGSYGREMDVAGIRAVVDAALAKAPQAPPAKAAAR